MGLLSIIRKQKLKDKEIRLLVLGLDNAGKTTILNCLMGKDVRQVTPTIGFQIHTISYREHTICAWDIGGQSTLRSFWGNYYDRLDVIMWVIDGTSARLQELYRELREQLILQDQLVGAYFIVAVNKMDMAPEEQKEAIVANVASTLDLALELPRSHYLVAPTSGVTGAGLDAVMSWLLLREIV